MFVAILRVNLKLSGCYSLKDKRSVLQSMLARARQKFHLSCAEVENREMLNLATLGFACVTSDHSAAERMQDKLLSLLTDNYDVLLLEHEKEIIKYG